MNPNCIALLLPIKLIHYLTKFLHQPMTSTYGCQQTNLKIDSLLDKISTSTDDINL